MLDSSIFEVIVGLIFVYSLLAILVTQINTILTTLVNLRARHLKGAMKALITDPTIQARFLTHPLINLVPRPLDPNRPLSAQGAERIVESGTSKVEWIEPRVFADVVVDLVSAQAGAAGDLYGPVLRVAETVLDPPERVRAQAILRRLQMTGEGLDELHVFVSALPDPADQQAMQTALVDLEAAIRQHNTLSADLVALLRGLRNVQNEEFQRALDALLKTARDVEDAKKRLAIWFDHSMEQVTDAYRRRLQIISLLVGLGLALVLNVDSLQLARALWDDPSLRAAVHAAAIAAQESGELARQIETASAGLADAQAQAAQTPGAPGAVTPEATPEPTGQQIVLDIGETGARAALTVESLLALNLPIGWFNASPAPDDPLAVATLTDTRNLWTLAPWNNPAGWFGLLLQKLVGLVLTTIAVSQGAPFWFDLMNRIARGRGG